MTHDQEIRKGFDDLPEPEEPEEIIVTININGNETYRKLLYYKYEDSKEYLKTKVSEIAYDIADTMLEEL